MNGAGMQNLGCHDVARLEGRAGGELRGDLEDLLKVQVSLQ